MTIKQVMYTLPKLVSHLVLSCSLLISLACNPDTLSDRELREGLNRGGPLEFAYREIVRSHPDCEEAIESNCARVELRYPEAVKGPGKLVAMVNDTIRHYLRASMANRLVDSTQADLSLDSMAARFIADYERFRSDRPDYRYGWSVEIEGQVLFQNPKVASVSLNTFSFTGGAHPNTFTYLLNFDLEDRSMLTIDDLIKDRDRLEALVKQKFREYHDLDQAADLREEGFFQNGRFFLPAYFAVRDEGLYFFYNNYEAAPYAAGPTEFTITFAELRGVINFEKII